MEGQRRFALLDQLLDLPRLYDVLPQRGAPHHADDSANLRYLRRRLDEQGATDVAIWLVDNPPEKLGDPRDPQARPAEREERRLRRRMMAAARDPAHGDHEVALRWLRRGQAYDVVRGVLRARAAGADAVLLANAFEARPDGHPSDRGCAARGLVQQGVDGAEGVTRAPAWHALAQLRAHLEGHRGVQIRRVAGSGWLVLLTYPRADRYAWLAVVLNDPRYAWSSVPGRSVVTRDIAVPLPDGRYRLEPCQLAPELQGAREVRVSGGSLRVALGPGPLYVVPIHVSANPR